MQVSSNTQRRQSPVPTIAIAPARMSNAPRLRKNSGCAVTAVYLDKSVRSFSAKAGTTLGDLILELTDHGAHHGGPPLYVKVRLEEASPLAKTPTRTLACVRLA